MTGVQTITVIAEDDGIRLDRWFKRHYPDVSHGRLEKLLRTGQVRIDGARAKAADRLNDGQTVRVPPLDLSPRPDFVPQPKPERKISQADIAFVQGLVLLVTDDMIVINKPAGLAVQGGTGTSRHLDGLLDGLIYDRSGRPKLVHRLDKDTSGILVLGRDARSADHLAKSFQSRRAEKIYWAVTAGVPRPHRGTIDLALAKLPGRGPDGAHERVVPVDEDDEEAKRAVTDYAVLAHAGKSAALVALRPRTGRTHQLRAHLAAIHCPILGDGKYGGPASRVEGAPSSRLHLHARALRLPAPDGRLVAIEAPPPAIFAQTLAFFGLEGGQDDPFAIFADHD
jgi:23S rRNA pseudouridine955/2504/2580 synthase